MTDADCYYCDGPGFHLGDLGSREWYRCRDCGAEWSESRDVHGDAREEAGPEAYDRDHGSPTAAERNPSLTTRRF